MSGSLWPQGTVWKPTTHYFDPSNPGAGGWDPNSLTYRPVTVLYMMRLGLR